MTPTRSRRRTWLAATATATALVLTSCSAGEDEESPDEDDSDQVVLVTHDSFDLPDEVLSQFRRESGYQVVVRKSGDAGALSAQLALTRSNPTGDAAYGIDNTFASRTLDEGVFAENPDAEVAPGADQYALPEGADRLTPVAVGHVCVNIDTTWFDEEGVRPPRTLEDLTRPAYADLFVTPAASTSSPGMAFLLSTVAAFGDEWPDYWSDLLGNGAKVVDGWSDAYYTDFTAGGGEGDRPVVLSYDSSPAFTVPEEGGPSTTRALLDTCFRQVEYAGVLDGADNPEGAQALVDFLGSDAVQEALPESMYVYPVSEAVELPEDWARHAEQPEDPFEVDPDEIAENREEWLREWTDVTTR